ncbi:acyl-CoA dehydrogenase family protein [Yinghuangia aomiensis]
MTAFTPFSLQLTDDQRTVQNWVRTFAADVLRPAAAEWDEREETPWPILQEAAKIGLYSLDFFSTQAFDPTGLGIPLTMEELFWGDAGLGLAITGTTLAAAGVVANGTPDQVATWAPRCSAPPTTSRSPPSAPANPDAAPTSPPMRTRATHDEATGDWILNGVKTWATNGGIARIHVVVATADPALGARGSSQPSSYPPAPPA